MAKVKSTFECMACGYQSPKWMGKCPNCGAWNQMEEVIEHKQKGPKNAISESQSDNKVEKLKDITKESVPRDHTQMKELDRVLGGGIVPGSLILIGGDPGIGKSTLLLQVCAMLSQNHPVLYISGEESVRQTKLRADRLLEDAGSLMSMQKPTFRLFTKR